MLAINSKTDISLCKLCLTMYLKMLYRHLDVLFKTTYIFKTRSKILWSCFWFFTFHFNSWNILLIFSKREKKPLTYIRAKWLQFPFKTPLILIDFDKSFFYVESISTKQIPAHSQSWPNIQNPKSRVWLEIYIVSQNFISTI